MRSACRLSIPLLMFIAIALTPAAGLAGVEDTASIRTLTPLLVAKDATVRMQAARKLVHIGQAAMPALETIYQTGTIAEKRGAIMGLALLPYPALGMGTMLSALEDQDTTTRSLAAHGLALAGSPVLPKLKKRLTSSTPYIRDGAAYALSLMGEPAVPALANMLQSSDTFARAKAAWLLGRMGNKALSAIPQLIAALQCDDIRVMHVTAEAIDQIGPDPAILLHHLMLLGVTESKPMTKLGRPAVPTLINLLSRPGTPLGQAAFRALAMVGNDAEPNLRPVVFTGAPSQQVSAALLLMEIDPDIVHTLPDTIRASLTGASQTQ